MSDDATSARDHEQGFWAGYNSELKGRSAFGKVTDLTKNEVMAKHLVIEERGGYGPYKADYRLSGETIGVLLSHTRQDAAQAMMNTISIWKMIRALGFMMACMFVLLLLNFALLVKLIDMLGTVR